MLLIKSINMLQAPAPRSHTCAVQDWRWTGELKVLHLILEVSVGRYSDSQLVPNSQKCQTSALAAE